MTSEHEQRRKIVIWTPFNKIGPWKGADVSISIIGILFSASAILIFDFLEAANLTRHALGSEGILPFADIFTYPRKYHGDTISISAQRVAAQLFFPIMLFLFCRPIIIRALAVLMYGFWLRSGISIILSSGAFGALQDAKFPDPSWGFLIDPVVGYDGYFMTVTTQILTGLFFLYLVLRFLYGLIPKHRKSSTITES